MSQAIQRFHTKAEKSGGKVVIVLPFNPNEEWGEKERHHITGSINGFTYRGPFSLDGALYFISLGAAWCRDTGLESGVEVDVVLAPEGPQTNALAEDIVSALKAEPQARRFFEGLATFYRKGYLRWIEATKRPETRAARIAEMIKLLKAGKKQR